jgi:hypothetical protein
LDRDSQVIKLLFYGAPLVPFDQGISTKGNEKRLFHVPYESSVQCPDISGRVGVDETYLISAQAGCQWNEGWNRIQGKWDFGVEIGALSSIPLTV